MVCTLCDLNTRNIHAKIIVRGASEVIESKDINMAQYVRVILNALKYNALEVCVMLYSPGWEVYVTVYGPGWEVYVTVYGEWALWGEWILWGLLEFNVSLSQ